MISVPWFYPCRRPGKQTSPPVGTSFGLIPFVQDDRRSRTVATAHAAGELVIGQNDIFPAEAGVDLEASVLRRGLEWLRQP